MDAIQAEVAAQQPAQRAQGLRWPAWLAGGLTLITLALWLLGYGYALAIESMFGIAQAHVVGSTLDYLGLAGHALAQLLLHALDNLRSPRAWWAGYAAAWPWVLGFLAMFWLLLAVLCWPLLRPLRRTAMVGTGRLAQNVRAHWQATRLPWMGVLASVVVAAAPVVGTAMVWLALAGGLSLMSLLPIIGLGLGKDVLQSWVVEPARCATPASRMQRLDRSPQGSQRSAREPVALCVAVRGPQGAVARGRLVAATAHVAVLFDPRTGAVWRIPVSGATVEPVASLDP